MQTLRERFEDESRFLFGVEMVSFRGSMAESTALKVRNFANELVDSERVDWISITDNAGGNPHLAPEALAKPMLYAGKEVVIHLTCKDLNRNGLESQAWMLHSEGFHNILAMTGDYPVTGNEGMAKPVFDIDSVGLISLLTKMNHGLDLQTRNPANARRLEKTDFFIGAVTTNFKFYEGEVIPQYLKLAKKVECGAQFIINQVGYDARKITELRHYMNEHDMRRIPLIGNVYVLNPRVAQVFHDKRIPGIVVTKELLEICKKYEHSEDRGKAFFHEFAAKQIAIYRGLGYRGAYLGGVHDYGAIEKIMDIERTFSPDDWKQFATEINFSRPGEFFFYPEKTGTGLADKAASPTQKPAGRINFSYLFSKWVHDAMFTPGKPLAKFFSKLYKKSSDDRQGPKLLRKLEHLSKYVLFSCKDCGDCSLPDIAYLCPESQCAKNQRNGPCGGTKDGDCEVDGIGKCIWLRAYNRLKPEGAEEELLAHSPMFQNQKLRGTSAWGNSWLERDHTAKKLARKIIEVEQNSDDQNRPSRTNKIKVEQVK